MATNWWDVGTKAADWWLTDKQIGDTAAQQEQGYTDARKDIKKVAGPYQDFSQWGMQGYKQEGPFDFSYEGYLSSPEFQWLQDQTRQATERGAAAGQQGLYSGQTLADVNDRLYNLNAQSYGAEHARQLAAQGAREDYWYRPVQTGGVLAGQTAQALADISQERGEFRARTTIAEQDNLNSLLSGIFGSADAAQQSGVADTIKQAWDAIGGEGGYGGTITDFAKDMFDVGLLGDLGTMGGDAAKAAWGAITGGGDTAMSGLGGMTPDKWATEGWTSPFAGPNKLAEMSSAIASGSVAGWSSVPGMSKQFVMNDAGFIVDLGSEGAAAASEGIAAAGQTAGMASDVMNFLSTPGGMGITAAAMVLLTGGDVKDAAVTGGASYLGAAIGSAIMPGIGTAIGGALGGMVASLGLSDKPAKADTVMMLSGSEEGFKKDAYATGAFGNVGFKGSATRHLDNVRKQYLPAFQTIAKVDDMVAGALTPEEVAKVTDYGKRYTYRKQSNEGKISPKKVMINSLRDRQKMLKRALGEERYAELQLNDLYSSMIQQIKG